MKDIIGKKQVKLFKSFIETESKEYPQSPSDRKKWITKLINIIEKEIKEKYKPFNRLIIRSHGNTGVLLRELMIDPISTYWDISKNSLIIDLCICGNLNCWGRITNGSN